MTELRPYQQAGVDEFNEARKVYRSILMVAPTASGKTVVGSACIKELTKEGKSVLVFAHTREIIGQTSTKLKDHGIPHGIIMAKVEGRELEAVQVGTIQTITARRRSSRLELAPPDLIVIDEAHRSLAQTYKKLIETYPDATILGLTVTPCRGDGRGLGGIYETLIELPQVSELIKLGYLVRTKVFAPEPPDLKGVATVLGDYNEDQLADRMNTARLVGNVVVHWLKHSEHRTTVCFGVNVAHSLHLRDEFLSAGVKAEHIDGKTPLEEREETLARLARGEIEVVTNCQVLTEGWDCPPVGCCILARPTKKMGLYRQMIGRVLRPAPGKLDAIILDHSGAVHRHGFVEDHVQWTLDPDKKAENYVHMARESRYSSSKLLDCSQCGAIREGGKPCFHCGFLPQRSGRDVQIHEGHLGLVGRDGRVQAAQADRTEWWAMLTHICTHRGYKPGWAAHLFKEKFGTWPPWGQVVAPREPSYEVVQYVRSRTIAYAKRRA